jgi:hypothetical protein
MPQCIPEPMRREVLAAAELHPVARTPVLYLDPGSGSIALQMAVAAVAAGAYIVKHWWTRIISTIQGVLRSLRRHP